MNVSNSMDYLTPAQTTVFSLFQFLCIPFLVLSPAVINISQTAHFNQSSVNSWIGELELADAGKWADEMLLLVSILTFILSFSV